jgi:hypothetical protein
MVGFCRITSSLRSRSDARSLSCVVRQSYSPQFQFQDRSYLRRTPRTQRISSLLPNDIQLSEISRKKPLRSATTGGSNGSNCNCNLIFTLIRPRKGQGNSRPILTTDRNAVSVISGEGDRLGYQEEINPAKNRRFHREVR